MESGHPHLLSKKFKKKVSCKSYDSHAGRRVLFVLFILSLALLDLANAHMYHYTGKKSLGTSKSNVVVQR